MLKTLIVDDEKLVRKGIIGLINWEKYDITIVGEAQNSRTAIEFLEKNAVDLLISDLTMPGLCGIPFLQLIKERFPQVKIIVLTMHQEFETLQRAMRLGVVDYITKAQLEKENIDEIMSNLSQRLQHSLEADYSGNENRQNAPYAWVLYTPNAIPERYLNKMEKIQMFILSKNFWISYEKQSQIPDFVSRDAVLLQIEHFSGLTTHQLTVLIDYYIGYTLFYERIPNTTTYFVDIKKFQSLQQRVLTFSRDELAMKVQDKKWIIDDAWYLDCINKIESMAMSQDELLVFFYQIYLNWSNYRSQDIAAYFEQTEQFHWWYQWKEWLTTQREQLGLIVRNNNDHGKMHIANILTYIQSHYTQDITLQQMLHMSGMSKSYFSQCFKKVTGKTFISYLKNIRVEQAKKLLLTTSQPIYWVSEQVGYPDERYFRRVFTECVGICPSEYRKKHK